MKTFIFVLGLMGLLIVIRPVHADFLDQATGDYYISLGKGRYRNAMTGGVLTGLSHNSRYVNLDAGASVEARDQKIKVQPEARLSTEAHHAQTEMMVNKSTKRVSQSVSAKNSGAYFINDF